MEDMLHLDLSLPPSHKE